MNIKNIHLAYYSATFSTKRIVREIASQFEKPVKEYDITSEVLKDDISLGSDGDLLIVVCHLMPVEFRKWQLDL